MFIKHDRSHHAGELVRKSINGLIGKFLVGATNIADQLLRFDIYVGLSGSNIKYVPINALTASQEPRLAAWGTNSSHVTRIL